MTAARADVAPDTFGAALDAWTLAHGASSLLCITSSHSVDHAVLACEPVARRGVRVVVTLSHDDEARACPGGEDADARPLPRSDFVVGYDTLSELADADLHLAALAARARSFVVIVVRKPRGALDRWLRTTRERAHRKGAIAPALWRLGRVRAYFPFDAGLLGPGGPLVAALPQALRERLARHHAFLVDVAPRTPQAKRRLVR